MLLIIVDIILVGFCNGTYEGTFLTNSYVYTRSYAYTKEYRKIHSCFYSFNHIHILYVVAFFCQWLNYVTDDVTIFFSVFIFQHFITCLSYLKHFTHFQHWIYVSDTFLKNIIFPSTFRHWHLANFIWKLNTLLVLFT